MTPIPELPDSLPTLSGHEPQIVETMAHPAPPHPDRIDFQHVRSAYAIALHMHQPLIPAGTADLTTAPIISNLQHMFDYPGEGDNHNAPVFQWCYKRMAEFIPQLVREGHKPRVMLDYSGCLLHGLQHDVLDALRLLTCDPRYAPCVEWLGTAWGHAVAPSTPVQDFRLHVRAWQHHFAALFGWDALQRVRGFSPPEMALPNHPDVSYEFVKTLKDCGYRWVLVQEHTVELAGPESDAGKGGHIRRPHIPHRLIARNSAGQTAQIIAILKTQGSDSKLVGQMQPYFEAKNLSRIPLAHASIPPLVTQIADGENGGVMMNEFPSKYLDVTAASSDSDTPPVTVAEYLDYLASLGIREEDFPPVQPVHQQKIWDRLPPDDPPGPEALEKLLQTLKQDVHFHMEGGSWTRNISWVRGYESLLGPMENASALFNEKMLARHIPTTDPTYRNALFHLLTSQTSCFRYWGQGTWTNYGRELCRRTIAILAP